MTLRSGMLRLPGPAAGLWHADVPRDWLPQFTTMAWADLAAQVMAMDSPTPPAAPGRSAPAAGSPAGPGGPPGRSAGGGGAGGGGEPPDGAPDGGELGPIGTRLLVTNELVNIWEVELAPGELQSWHRHAYPYVVVVMEDSVGEITLPDGEIRTPASGRGAVVFDPGGTVHKLRNIGSEVLWDRLIEFKAPLNPDLAREIAR